MTQAIAQWGLVTSMVSAIAGVASVMVAAHTIRKSGEALKAQREQDRQAAAEQAAHTVRLVELEGDILRASNFETTAHETYNHYLTLCIERPELTSWLLAKKSFGFTTPRQVFDQGTVESERYLWFVSYMLNACERIVLATEGSEGAAAWIEVVRSQLSYHKSVLAVMFKELGSHYDGTFGRLVCQTIKCPGCDTCREGPA